MFQVAVDNSFNFNSPEYGELYDRSDATAFQHPLWLTALYGKLVGREGTEPLILVIRSSANGRLAMVLPLVRRRYAALRVVEFADLRVSDYAAPVVDAGTFAQILQAHEVIDQIGRLLRPYDLMRIGKLADQSLPLERLFGASKRQGMGTNAYAAPLGAVFEEWRDGRLDRSYRKELDKKTRQLHRRGQVRFTCAANENDIRTVFEALKTYRGRRFDGSDGEPDLLQNPVYFDFYLGVGLAGLGGFARAYALWVDEQPVAVAFGLVHHRSFLVILSGFDQERFARQSVGSLVFEQVVRDCIERGDKVLDFTIGDEPYKIIFGGQPSPMWRISRAGSPLGFAVSVAVERLPVARALARRMRGSSSGSTKSKETEEPHVRPANATADS